MKALSRRLVGTVVAMFLVVSAPSSRALAVPDGKKDDEAKLPHPSKHLKKAYLKLRALDSYRVSLRVEGGLSKDEKHSLSRVTVRQNYVGDVFQNKLMHLPGINAYRTPKKGAIRAGGIWKNALGDKNGTLMQRLFAFPLEVLGKAVRHSRRAEWVKSSIQSELGGIEFELLDLEDEEEENEAETDTGDDVDDLFDDLFGEEGAEDKTESASTDSDKPRGKTVVAGGADEKEETELRLPRVVRIEVPPKEALRHYLAVEKSGCIGGG